MGLVGLLFVIAAGMKFVQRGQLKPQLIQLIAALFVKRNIAVKNLRGPNERRKGVVMVITSGSASQPMAIPSPVSVSDTNEALYIKSFQQEAGERMWYAASEYENKKILEALKSTSEK